jgi:hypothetical protein
MSSTVAAPAAVLLLLLLLLLLLHVLLELGPVPAQRKHQCEHCRVQECQPFNPAKSRPLLNQKS